MNAVCGYIMNDFNQMSLQKKSQNCNCQSSCTELSSALFVGLVLSLCLSFLSGYMGIKPRK